MVDSSNRFFVCKPLACLLSLAQCQRNRQRPKSPNGAEDHGTYTGHPRAMRPPACDNCELWQTAAKYNYAKIQAGAHNKELESIKQPPALDRKVIVPSIFRQ